MGWDGEGDGGSFFVGSGLRVERSFRKWLMEEYALFGRGCSRYSESGCWEM